MYATLNRSQKYFAFILTNSLQSKTCWTQAWWGRDNDFPSLQHVALLLALSQSEWLLIFSIWYTPPITTHYQICYSSSCLGRAVCELCWWWLLRGEEVSQNASKKWLVSMLFFVLNLFDRARFGNFYGNIDEGIIRQAVMCELLGYKWSFSGIKVGRRFTRGGLSIETYTALFNDVLAVKDLLQSFGLYFEYILDFFNSFKDRSICQTNHHNLRDSSRNIQSKIKRK